MNSLTTGMESEVTPFAVIKNTETGKKCPLEEYSLTPSVAIIDPMFCVSLPKKARTDCGINVLVHVVDAYVPVITNEYTDGLVKKTGKLVFDDYFESFNGVLLQERRCTMQLPLMVSRAAFNLPYGRCVAVLLKSETTAEGVEVLAKAKTSTHIVF
ncbi:hypothetical protein EIN_147020 [Entamoeba invadens IP1]|uniref:Uncharacterized protein n=1 Tax=Entamoeba invadens IP1 TaxID=370355 RepID=L7FMI7_ENTIV|nr:hypothetical protein EIN_147020 [Entamoeba invadens IP1]ELP89074.1 hypothetical protein EIN_147020 [Entamoeba invadens IP1]|eukprot:XP_004255845.1 hypothetical protein EIN_147020 [Entamoeba invadens IP1]